MPEMILSVDGIVIKEVELTKDRTTLGRRPYNDIVIDDLAVSGEHAVFQMTPTGVYLEDLHSTNGSYVNGKAIQKQLLRHGDVLEVGKCQIKFVSDAESDRLNKTMLVQTGAPGLAAATTADLAEAATVPASIKVLSGAAAGRELPLTKAVTTLGKPGVAVAAITRGSQGFEVRHIEGVGPSLNGTAIGANPVALKNGDLIELAGTRMQFTQV
jgi:pSer/pThr/pTyr-binding forkhead associated (FHA) protein